MCCHTELEAQEKAAEPRGVISKATLLAHSAGRQGLTQAGVSPHKGLLSPRPAPLLLPEMWVKPQGDSQC